MVYMLVWSVVAILLAAWSLGAWALHAAAGWTLATAGALGASGGIPQRIGVPDTIAGWLPPEILQGLGGLIDRLGPTVEAVLQAAPAIAGDVSGAVWIAWAVGSALLVLLGVAAHAAVAVVRRRSGPPARPPARIVTAR